MLYCIFVATLIEDFKEKRAAFVLKEKFKQRISLAHAFKLLDFEDRGYIQFEVFLEFIKRASKKEEEEVKEIWQGLFFFSFSFLFFNLFQNKKSS